MKDEPLITITRVVDSECDPEIVGTLDYIIHCQALESWLAAGAGYREPQTVSDRQRALAAELRSLADQLIAGEGPFTVTVADAEKRATETRARVATIRRSEFTTKGGQ